MPKYSPRSAARKRKAVSAMTTALGNRISGAKKAVIDKTADVLSFPARAYHGSKERQANRDYNTLKRARAYDDAPNFDSKGNATDALKARTAADEVRMRRSK